MGNSKEEKGDTQMEDFKEEDFQLLIQMVKECQRKKVEGREGKWEQFRSLHSDEKAVSNDPAKHSWTLLAKFIESLDKEEDIQVVKRMQKWQAQKLETEQLNTSDPWPSSPEQELVERSQKHTHYKTFYKFPSYSTNWVCTKRGKSSSVVQPGKILALDCEMCVSVGQERELVRLAVVDRDLKVLVNTLVAPSLKVIDYKADITGVGPEELKDITFSQLDAQKAVLDLVTPGTILVGHGLHHDLKVLKIDHERVIDTALLFQYKGLETVIPALRDLAKVVLKESFRKESTVHDSVEDAIVPMKLVEYLIKNGPSPPLDPPDIQVDKGELLKLFIHRIPSGTTQEDLEPLFSNTDLPHIQMFTWKTSKFGTTFAVFENPLKANTAFKLLKGAQDKDALGRAQKTVSFKTKSGSQIQVVVRKMGCHNGQLFGVDSRKGPKKGKEEAKNNVDNEDKKEKKEKKEKKRAALVETTGEDLIEGLNGQLNAKKRKPNVTVTKEREREESSVEMNGNEEMGEVKVKEEDEGKTVAPLKQLNRKGREDEAKVKKSILKTGESNSKKRRREKRLNAKMTNGQKGGSGGNGRVERVVSGGNGRERVREGERTGGVMNGMKGSVVGKDYSGGNNTEVELQVETLKRKLKEREAEVAALQRIVGDLAKKQSSD